ncbi:MAG: hypothetical protein JWM12_3925 [Ilumatobacteraceae bacterium]|nr:hypothetical protein [Ilumatobacteraceae bacterium]
MAQTKITRDDLEAGIRRLQGDAQERVTDKKKTLATIGCVAAVVVVLVVVLLGKRSGKKKTTLVEIRRV